MISFTENRLTIRADLEEIPIDILKYSKQTNILDLSDNQLSRLPDFLQEFENLRILFLTDNKFTEIPGIIKSFSNLDMISFKNNKILTVNDNALPRSLKWLILTNNNIEELPDDLGNYSLLRKVALAGNNIREIPKSIQNCKNLQLMRVSANHLRLFPEVLLSLPRLIWLSYGGNDFNKKREHCDNLFSNNNLILWQDLQIKKKIGQGASGEVFLALNTKSNKLIAVKVYRDVKTSDGLAYTELATLSALNYHKNIINLIGIINNHPDGLCAIAMEYIPENFEKLADPPSLQSCTRDVFKNTKRLSAVTSLQLLTNISDALFHLHENGVIHGDLYAHNILYNQNGSCYVGDFGAASFCDHFEFTTTTMLKKIETRALGYLIEEVCSVTDFLFEYSSLFKELGDLASSCRNFNLTSALDSEFVFEKIQKLAKMYS